MIVSAHLVSSPTQVRLVGAPVCALIAFLQSTIPLYQCIDRLTLPDRLDACCKWPMHVSEPAKSGNYHLRGPYLGPRMLPAPSSLLTHSWNIPSITFLCVSPAGVQAPVYHQRAQHECALGSAGSRH